MGFTCTLCGHDMGPRVGWNFCVCVCHKPTPRELRYPKDMVTPPAIFPKEPRIQSLICKGCGQEIYFIAGVDRARWYHDQTCRMRASRRRRKEREG